MLKPLKATPVFFGENTVSPQEYVLSKLRICQVVGLGEDYWIKNQVFFVENVIRQAIRENLIDCVALEFGNAKDHKIADELIAGDTFSREKALAMLLDVADLGWGYEDYISIFKAVWEENLKRPQNKKIRIILTDNPFMLLFLDGEPNKMPYVNLPSVANFVAERNKYMAHVISNEIMEKGFKAIYYAGSAHVAIRTDFQLSTGQYIQLLYPNKYFPITLHGFDYGTDKPGFAYHANRKIEQELDKVKTNTFAIDLAGTELGKLSLAEYFGQPRKGKDKLLADEFYGYIFFGSLDNYMPVTRIAGYYDNPEVFEKLQNRLLAFLQRKSDKKLTKDDVPLKPILERIFKEERPILSREKSPVLPKP